MYLQRKLEELKAFLEHTTGIAEPARQVLEAYISKWGDDLRTELGLAFKPGASLGISFDPIYKFALIKLPDGLEVKEGLYISNDGKLKLEVTGQDPISGIVQLEVSCEDVVEQKLEAMSAHLFVRLFHALPVETS